MVDDITTLGDDLTKAHLQKTAQSLDDYLTINTNAFREINTQKYIFLNLHI
jgi:hypothetical protein